MNKFDVIVFGIALAAFGSLGLSILRQLNEIGHELKELRKESRERLAPLPGTFEYRDSNIHDMLADIDRKLKVLTK